MKTILINNRPAFTDVVAPCTFWQRAKGLLGHPPLKDSEAMWFDRCSSVHMFGMKFPLDIIFLDQNNTVVKIVEDLKPWRIANSRDAKTVVEVQSGICSIKKISMGDQLSLISEANT